MFAIPTPSGTSVQALQQRLALCERQYISRLTEMQVWPHPPFCLHFPHLFRLLCLIVRLPYTGWHSDGVGGSFRGSSSRKNGELFFMHISSQSGKLSSTTTIAKGESIALHHYDIIFRSLQSISRICAAVCLGILCSTPVMLRDHPL